MPKTFTMPNNMTLTQSYEAQRDLLTGMDYKRGDTLISRRTYAYDTLGIPTARSTNREGTTRNDAFTHNDRQELTAATLGTDNYAYAYDNIGNRKTAQEVTEEVTQYNANNLNQYTAIDEFVPTYDADGNQTKIQTSTGIWDVTYNALNRPISFTSEDESTVIECAYDTWAAEPRRKSPSTVKLPYTSDTSTVATSKLPAWSSPVPLILWDPTQPIATRPLAIQKDGTWYTYGRDLTKNICEVFGPAGYIRTTYTYTPFGTVTAEGDVTQPIQWSSEYADEELGLIYYNYRHYSPRDGRWINRDPIGESGGKSLYWFVRNSLVYTDNLGMIFDWMGEQLHTYLIEPIQDSIEESIDWGVATYATEKEDDTCEFFAYSRGIAVGLSNFIGIVDVVEASEGTEISFKDIGFEQNIPIPRPSEQEERITKGLIGSVSIILTITPLSAYKGVGVSNGKQLFHLTRNHNFVYDPSRTLWAMTRQESKEITTWSILRIPRCRKASEFIAVAIEEKYYINFIKPSIVGPLSTVRNILGHHVSWSKPKIKNWLYKQLNKIIDSSLNNIVVKSIDKIIRDVRN